MAQTERHRQASWHYSPECVEGEFAEVRIENRSDQGVADRGPPPYR
jgi:hypothetical protein